MDQRREEAYDAIRFRIWSGYYGPEEVFDIVCDEVYGSDDEVEAWLHQAIDQEFRKKREAEQDWPAITDCDRLDEVFESLRSQSILTHHRCGLTMQDGLDVVNQLYTDASEEKSGFVGYCFYQLQDMEGAMWGTVGLWLAFGSFRLDQERAIQVGQLVRKEFERTGFTIEWDGTAESRILLKSFQWHRRSPVQPV